MNLLAPLAQTVIKLSSEVSLINEPRKKLLQELSDYINQKRKKNEVVKLNFICTHNSRRSHLSQVWAQTAAYYYKLDNILCYSGGTEATAFNINAVNALRTLGFEIQEKKPGKNPEYEILFGEGTQPIIAFSKTYNHDFNPSSNFAAIMTCSDADENCPFIPGADLRLALTYEDPKKFDGTPQQFEKYLERSNQIGRELLYCFSRVEK